MAWSPSSSSQSPPGINTIQPYRMHVSQKYLDLTKQKLELTRLPRDPRNVQRGHDFGLSKTDLEPLVDHWLEEYNWRAQETFYNDLLPQFRMPINGTRLHFVHKRSPSPTAIPLLFLHGWPESFISVSKVIDALCSPVTTPPRGDDGVQAFHVVAPSIPGFGFSDPVQEASNNIQATADIFDAMMKGLGYQRYMIHGSGWGFRIGRVLALIHPESCMALHTVNPDVPSPRSVFGYSPEDLSISSPMSDLAMQTPGMTPPSTPSLMGMPLERPQTSAYALSDSPSGLLAYILDAIKPSSSTPSPAPSPTSLRVPSSAPSPTIPQGFGLSPQSSRSPTSQSPTTPGNVELGDMSNPWPPGAIVNWTMMYWLPGPEVALRWVANSTPLLSTLWTSHSLIPLGITHFRDPAAGRGEFQTPPQWAEGYHRIAMLRRRDGRVRFAAWERPGELVLDIREFANMLNAEPAVPMTDGFNTRSKSKNAAPLHLENTFHSPMIAGFQPLATGSSDLFAHSRQPGIHA